MQCILLLTLGWLAIVLGTLGIVLPLSPTTPFMLLVPGVLPVHRRVSITGCYLRHWRQHRAMPPGAKVRAICLIMNTFSLFLFLVHWLWIRMMMLIMLVLLLLFMWRIPVVAEAADAPTPR